MREDGLIRLRQYHDAIMAVVSQTDKMMEDKAVEESVSMAAIAKATKKALGPLSMQVCRPFRNAEKSSRSLPRPTNHARPPETYLKSRVFTTCHFRAKFVATICLITSG